MTRRKWCRTAPPDAEKEAQLIRLRLSSPQRPVTPQHDASDLELFRTANEPRLI